ncbi:MAG: tetratricopeptide repeat protein [Promethearchaeia archaeon]
MLVTRESTLTRRDAGSAWLYYTTEYDMHDVERAEQYLRLALQRDPLYPDALHMLARILSEARGLIDEAESMYKTALLNHPTHLDSLWSYGAFLQDYRSDSQGALGFAPYLPCSCLHVACDL